jgi:hypothetical protein
MLSLMVAVFDTGLENIILGLEINDLFERFEAAVIRMKS